MDLKTLWDQLFTLAEKGNFGEQLLENLHVS